MAYFEQTYNGSVAKFGTSKPDVYMYMRIYGNTYPEARYLEYYVTIGSYYAYRSAWTWKETNFVVGGTDYLNGTDLAFNANGGATDLMTVGPFRVNYGLDGNAGAVQLWGRLYNGSVKNTNTGKNYSLDTRLDSVWYSFPWIAAATAPGKPSNQLINGSANTSVNERSDNLRLTWSAPNGGTFGIAGYRVFCSRGEGWKQIGTTSNTYFDTSINSLQSTVYGGTMPRGHSIGFYIQAYNSQQDSGYVGDMYAYNKLTLNNMSFNSISASNVSFYSATINWASNINVKTVEYSYNNSSWTTAQSNINTTSSSFSVSGRASGTQYTVYVRLTAASDGTQVTKSVTFTTSSMTMNVSNSGVSHYTATVNWSSNVNIKTVEYNLNGAGWIATHTGLNTASGSFGLSGLSSNTGYTVQVRLTGYADGKTITKNTSFTTKATDVSISTNNITPLGVDINWSSSVNIKTVQWKLSTEPDSSYRNAQTGLNTKSSSFKITSLTFNTSYTINVRVTGYADSKTATASTTIKTLDIARLTAVTKSWDVDKSAEITATNPAGCALQLYIDYYTNNTWVALISRAPITLDSGKYKITLTTSEVNMLYKRASGDTNAKFRFTLKSLYPNYLGEHTMETKITFPTKAWVRPDGTGEWKRALVWARDASGNWKQVSPWVDPTNNKNWKKI